MASATTSAPIVLLAAVLWSVQLPLAAAQTPGTGDLVFDPTLGQYLSFTPEQPLVPSPCGPAGCDECEGMVTDGDPFTADDGDVVCSPLNPSWWGPPWVQRFTLFAGLHGFKGPTDLGRNGNFGFHEGLNYGAPLWELFGLGYQVGFQATHSNFKGNRVVGQDDDSRHQLFFSAGFFHRTSDFGLQSAMVFDFFHDEYYDKADLKQIRSENALRLGELREIGYWGAYNVGGDRIRLTDRITQPLRPEDLFALFYRRHFTGGGQGRVWGGMSGDGDFFFGAETTVPLGTNWALENNFAYLLPKEGSGADGQGREIWAMSMQLVWYPGRPARCVFRDPYQPFLGVADNSVFMVKRN
jgi:hypothetical protein